MLYTKKQAMENIRNREGERVFYLGREDQLTSEARDYLQAQRIQILPAQAARPERYRLLGGGYAEEKPEHMTHLNGELLVSKTHPRIRFRGEIDRLEAELLLCLRELPELTGELSEILELARRLIRCDVLDEPVGEINLCGLSCREQRLRSHAPAQYYGIPHFMPSPEDSREILLLNRLRTVVRSGELAAVEAFTDQDGRLLREDMVQAMNRISSMLYILMLRQKAQTGL